MSEPSPVTGDESERPGRRGRVADDAHLVIDLGTVSEDALVVVPESLTVNGADSAFADALARMPAVDRAILRIGVWEVLFNDEIPAAVAIDEAVESAKTLSTDDSAGFVNGLLGKIAQANG